MAFCEKTFDLYMHCPHKSNQLQSNASQANFGALLTDKQYCL